MLDTVRAAAIYTLLTVVSTWPMAANLTVMDAGDGAFFAWEMAWEIHALLTDPAQLPHANIFHPLRNTLAMDEPIFGTTLLALPFAVFTNDAVWVHNVVRLLTFVLTALATWALARDLGCREAAALLAGAAFAFSPIRTDKLAHLSTLGTQYLPLVLLFMLRFFRHGRLRDGLAAAACFVLAALACGYHGVIALAVLPPAALLLLWGRWSLLPKGLLAAAVAALGLLPLYLMHRAGLGPESYVRGADETQFFSAALETFLATTSWNRVWGDVTGEMRTTHANNLFPGLVLPALIAFGAASHLKARRWPSREVVALLAIAVGAALVALGPEVRLFGKTLFVGPFGLLRDAVPVFQMIRVPSRSGAFLALPLAVLAARVLSTWRPRPLVLAAVAAAALAETVIAPIPMPGWMKVVDTRRPVPPVYEWLAAQPGHDPIVELPMLDIAGVMSRPAFHESIYLVWSTRHWKPLLNGYAGIEPVSYRDLREKAKRFPSEASLDAFRERGARYVIVHRLGFGPNQWARIERDMPAFRDQLREVARFGDDVVYELGPQGGTTSP